jgi:hypothetical protein
LGYLQHPDMVNNHLVFCAEGVVFITTVSSLSNDDPPKEQEQNANTNTPPNNTIPNMLPAVKLNSSVGNVLDPKLHPSLSYLAYTATYSGRRDVYLLMDLRGGGPQSAGAIRLTFWDISMGVSGLIGWWGNALVFWALSNQVSLPDYCLYVLYLDDHYFWNVDTTADTADNSNTQQQGGDEKQKPPGMPTSATTTTGSTTTTGTSTSWNGSGLRGMTIMATTTTASSCALIPFHSVKPLMWPVMRTVGILSVTHNPPRRFGMLVVRRKIYGRIVIMPIKRLDYGWMTMMMMMDITRVLPRVPKSTWSDTNSFYRIEDILILIIMTTTRRRIRIRISGDPIV